MELFRAVLGIAVDVTAGRIPLAAPVEAAGALNAPLVEGALSEVGFLTPLAAPDDEAADVGRAIPVAAPPARAVVDAKGARALLVAVAGVVDDATPDLRGARTGAVLPAVAAPGRPAVVRGGTAPLAGRVFADAAERVEVPVPVAKEAFAAATTPGLTAAGRDTAVFAKTGLTGDAVAVLPAAAVAVAVVPVLRTTGGARAVPVGAAFLSGLCDGVDLGGDRDATDVSAFLDSAVSASPAS